MFLVFAVIFPATGDDLPSGDLRLVNSGTTCGPYGLSESDPRSEPPAIARQDADRLPVDGDVDGLELDREHVSAEGTTGNYHLFARGVDFTQPVGVVVRLHGEGAHEYESPGRLLNCLATVAESYNMVLVAPRSPLEDGNGDATWREDPSTGAAWVRDLLESRVLSMDNVDPSSIWWVGHSGGADFITTGMMPENPDLFTGGVALFGGGDAPDSLDDQLITDEQRRHLPLYWAVGDEDDGSHEYAPSSALPSVGRGATFFRERGFEHVYPAVLEGRDRFDLPQVGILDEVLFVEYFPEKAAQLAEESGEKGEFEAALESTSGRPEFTTDEGLAVDEGPRESRRDDALSVNTVPSATR